MFSSIHDLLVFLVLKKHLPTYNKPTFRKNDSVTGIFLQQSFLAEDSVKEVVLEKLTAIINDSHYNLIFSKVDSSFKCSQIEVNTSKSVIYGYWKFS